MLLTPLPTSISRNTYEVTIPLVPPVPRAGTPPCQWFAAPTTTVDVNICEGWALGKCLEPKQMSDFLSRLGWLWRDAPWGYIPGSVACSACFFNGLNERCDKSIWSKCEQDRPGLLILLPLNWLCPTEGACRKAFRRLPLCSWANFCSF